MYVVIRGTGGLTDTTRIRRGRRHRVAGRGPSLRRPTLETPPELPEWARAGKPSRLQRFATWFNSPPWWVTLVAATLLTAFVSIQLQVLSTKISNQQARDAARLENLRFVRQLSSEPGVVARPFSKFDLQGQDLALLDLTGASLSDANLRDANLYSADLSPASPTQPTKLPRHSDLSGADLTGASLMGANLTGADLSVANLTGAILSAANLTGANLTVANLRGAWLPCTYLDPLRGTVCVNLTGADLSYADLMGAHLESADLSGANLTGAKLTGAQLVCTTPDPQRGTVCVNLTGADLSGTNLSGANLTGANLTGARLLCTYLDPLRGVICANLTGADLTGADLSRVDLSRADLTGVRCDEKTKWPSGFKPPPCGQTTGR